MILLIDNYDSFSYNLYQMVGEIDPDIRVIRNDERTVEEIRAMAPDRIILSPGPGRPEDAGVICEVAAKLGREIPVLGVCLGHQAICVAFGATVTYARRLMHGKQSVARFDGDCPLFAGCPQTAPVARYHSLAADPATMPECLKVTAVTVGERRTNGAGDADGSAVTMGEPWAGDAWNANGTAVMMGERRTNGARDADRTAVTVGEPRTNGAGDADGSAGMSVPGDDGGEIMAVQHRKYPIFGVQFHPESIMTPDGRKMLENFIQL